MPKKPARTLALSIDKRACLVYNKFRLILKTANNFKEIYE